jgi:hypothetical protein
LRIILHILVAEGTDDLFARRPVRAGLNVAMESAEFRVYFIPAVAHAPELGFSVRIDRPCLRPIALLGQAVGLYEQIAGGLSLEVGKAQNDERK